MTINVEAVYEDGVLKLQRPLALKDKARVRVTIEAESASEDQDPTGWKAADRLIGSITEPLVADDVVENHDRHIYRHDR